MNDRAFFIRPIYKGWLRKRLIGYKISDGYNEVIIGTHSFFLVDTNQPITTKVVKAGL